jgi:hypothetical protein
MSDLPDDDPVALVAWLVLQIEQKTAERVAADIDAGTRVPESVRMAHDLCEHAAAMLSAGMVGRG